MNVRPGRRPTRNYQLDREAIESIMRGMTRYSRGRSQVLWCRLAEDTGIGVNVLNYIRNKNGYMASETETRIIAETLGVTVEEISTVAYSLDQGGGGEDLGKGVYKIPNVLEQGDDGEMMLIEAIIRTAAADYRRAYRRRDYATMRDCERCFTYWLGGHGEDAAAYLRRLEDEGRKDLPR